MTDALYQLMPMVLGLVAVLTYKGTRWHPAKRGPKVVTLTTETPAQTLARIRAECEEADKVRQTQVEWTLAPGSVIPLPRQGDTITANTIRADKITANRIYPGFQ